jgi:hypothetical protein
MLQFYYSADIICITYIEQIAANFEEFVTLFSNLLKGWRHYCKQLLENLLKIGDFGKNYSFTDESHWILAF